VGECGVGLAAVYLASFWVLRSLRRSIFRSIGRTPEALTCNHSMQYIIGRQRPSTTQWIVYTYRNKSEAILKVPSAYTSAISKWHVATASAPIIESTTQESIFLAFFVSKMSSLLRHGVWLWSVELKSALQLVPMPWPLVQEALHFVASRQWSLSFRLVADSSTHIGGLPF